MREPMGGSFLVSKHPLVIHKLSYLRQPKDKLGERDYPALLKELGMLLAVEATANMPLTDIPPEDGWLPRRALKGKNAPIIVAIVRSGLAMAEGAREIIPSLAMGHIGLFRDPDTGEMLEFIVTMPSDTEDRSVFIVDAFVDSGTTAIRAIQIANGYGIEPRNIRYICIYVSNVGYMNIQNDPLARKVKFHCAHVDGLNGAATMFTDFRDFNERLYQTAPKRSGTLPR
jgi:uracil phosphoribosyltransferase